MTHMELLEVQLKGEAQGRWFAEAILAAVFTALAMLLATRAFEVRSYLAVAGCALVLWSVCKVTIASVAPQRPLSEAHLRRRIKAREADERGHCVIGSNCPVCRGMPTKPQPDGGT